MSFAITITGDVDPDDTKAHAQIQKLTQDLVNKLAAAGATVSSSQAETPSGTTTPIPAAVQIVTAGGTATITGGGIATNDEAHALTAGSPPKGPK